MTNQESNSKKQKNSNSAGTQRSASSQQRSGNSQQRSASGQQRSGNSQQRSSKNQRRPAKRRRRRVSPLLITLIVILVVVIAAFAGLGLYASQYTNYVLIMPNVYVAGIDVGGMTTLEATEAIESALTDTAQQSVNVILPDRTLTFSPEQDTILIDVDQAVAEAYSYGRASTSPFAIARSIKAAQRTRNDIDITSALEVDTDYIHNIIETTASQVETSLIESTVIADTDNHLITVTIGTPGQRIDTEELYELVYNAFISGDYSDIDFDYDIVYPATIQLDTLYSQMSVECHDAVYNAATDSIEPETIGYTPSVDLDTANQQLATASSGDVLVFSFDEVYPSITAEDLGANLFQDVLISYGTVYAVNEGRTENLRIACETINGTVIEPDEVFSFNEVVGERTEERGYQDAIVYKNGDSVSEPGGGVCQVASTIYYCAMYTDMEIVERTEHQFLVDYVPGGLDATVYWGSLDFKFRNNTGYPLKINAYLDGGRCWIEFIGTDVNHYTIEIESEITSMEPYETKQTSDQDEVQSGYTGYTYEITRYVYDSDGNLIRTDTTEDLDNLGGLGTSEYEKRDEYVYSASAGYSESSSETSETYTDYSSSYTDTSSSTSTTTPAASTAPAAEPSVEPSVETTPEPAAEPETAVEPEPAVETVPDTGGETAAEDG